MSIYSVQLSDSPLMTTIILEVSSALWSHDNYSYHPVLCTPLFLCTVAIFEGNSLLFNVKQVVFYRDMSEVQFELVIASSDDVNHSVGPDVTIWGCVSKNLQVYIVSQ
jgi:hypothetical protein